MNSSTGDEQMASNQFQVYLNTQIEVEDLRLAIGNIREEVLTEDSGTSLKSKTVGVWLYFRDKPGANTKLRMHSGHDIECNNYLIKMIQISSDSKGIYAVFEIIRLLE